MILPKSITIFFQSILYFFTFVLFKTFCKFEVSGLENVMNLEPGIIFAANHTSEWDGILVRVALPFFSNKFSPMYYVSRVSDFYVESGWRRMFYGGIIFKILGAYPAYSGKNDYRYSLTNFISILKLNRNVCIFPEGKRSKNGKIGEAHGGVIYLSNVANRPIVPVAIVGVYNLSLLNFLMFKRKVFVIFGEPIIFKKTNSFEGDGEINLIEIKSRAEFVLRQVENLKSKVFKQNEKK